MPMRRTALPVLLCLAALAAPASALASTSDTIHKDCQDGKINGSYTQSQYSAALKNIPTDLDEYTDCRDVIRRAQLAAAGSTSSKDSSRGGGGAAGGGSSSGGTGGGAVTPATPSATGGTAAQLLATASPAEQSAVQQAIASSGDNPVQVGGQTVSADKAGLSPAGAANVLPTPVWIALVLLGLGLIAGGATSVRSLVLARRRPASA